MHNRIGSDGARGLARAAADGALSALVVLGLSGNPIGDEGVRALAEAGADLNKARTSNGATALHMAARGGKAEVVRALVEAGADLFKAAFDGSTPLYVAGEACHVDVVRAFVP